MFAVFAAILCLMAVGHSAPLACEDLVRPSSQLEPSQLEGRWALVAVSVLDAATAHNLKGRHSVAVDLHNSTYTQADLVDGVCKYRSRNISLEGHLFTIRMNMFNLTGTFVHTSCPDCAALISEMKSSNQTHVEFLLFSRRRELEQSEVEEFRAQVECRKMPPPIVMDPTKELCPEQTSTPAA